MPLLLLELARAPGRIAATTAGSSSVETAFYLDFSRPLRVERWLGVWNFRVGFAYALHVPVVHHSEAAALHTIAVERADPYFGELQRLWRSRFPAPNPAPGPERDPAKVAADFAHHFPSEPAGADDAA